jgi:competence protein ComEC
LGGVRDEGLKVEVLRAGYRMDWGGVRADVIAPPPGELFSETNDNSVAILLSYGQARVLVADDAQARWEEYMMSGSYTRP